MNDPYQDFGKVRSFGSCASAQHVFFIQDVSELDDDQYFPFVAARNVFDDF